MEPHIISITATHGRHECLERVVSCLINQDYKGKYTIFIHNNSEVSQKLDNIIVPSNFSIKLINQSYNSSTQKPYTSLGDIYNDSLRFLPEADIICFSDDDDLFLPDHISKGVEGLIKCGKKAYKPAKSYYRHCQGIELMSNTLEPSIFVYANHVFEHGFSNTTTEQHLQWVHPLMEKGEIFADPEGKPTLIYNWGDTHIATYKTSGDFHNPNNFENCRNYSRSHGDQIITPISREALQAYYNTIV